MSAEPSRGPSAKALLLGLFVLFQVAYLPLANVIQLIPREVEPRRGEFNIRIQREGIAADTRWARESINALGDAIERYGEATGQVQAWSLFAPDVEKSSVFPIVELYGTGANGPYISALASHFMPRDPANYFRPPSFLSRLNSYDYLLAVIFARFNVESLAERGHDWRQAVFERVYDQQRSLLAYFRFTLGLHRRQHPGEPDPEQMILRVEIYPTPEPGSTDRPKPIRIRLARWFPGRLVEPGYLPVEACDPLTGQFVRLPEDR